MAFQVVGGVVVAGVGGGVDEAAAGVDASLAAVGNAADIGDSLGVVHSVGSHAEALGRRQ